MSLAIREAAAEDAATVIALWETAGLTRPWNDPQADFNRALAWPGSTVLIAGQDDGAVGTAMTGFDGHRGWIYYLAVRPDLHRRGIGKALLDRCATWLRERGCPKVELMVRDGNLAASVYERLGWDLQNVRVFARWLDDEGR